MRYAVPEVRYGLARIVSLNFLRLLARGQVCRPRSGSEKVKACRVRRQPRLSVQHQAG